MNGEESQGNTASNGVILIRKYPNRRFYNTQSSRHVTLQEIRDLVREGSDIKVEDSKSGEDITVSVLTQILLEIESPKLVFFPVNLLHHLIRVNSGFMKSVSEDYFNQMLMSFKRAQESWGGTVLPGWTPPFMGGSGDWARAWSTMFETAGGQVPEEDRGGPAKAAAAGEPGSDTVEALRREIAELRDQLERMQKSGK